MDPLGMFRLTALELKTCGMGGAGWRQRTRMRNPACTLSHDGKMTKCIKRRGGNLASRVEKSGIVVLHAVKISVQGFVGHSVENAHTYISQSLCVLLYK